MLHTVSNKMSQQFFCEKCNYICGKKSDYNKHLNSNKHNATECYPNATPDSLLCKCGKQYKHSSSFYRHKKTCKYDESSDTNNNISDEEPLNDDNQGADVKVLSNTIFELVKQNNEFKQLLIEQNHKMMEMAGNMGNNNNNTNINSNNKFNLNVFLNDKCKNAMTLKDFVKSINISVQDFIETGERGFIDGISNIIVERINEMEIHDRPLHCTDLKRETVYIKDDGKWEKDEDKVKLRKAVKGVAYKNERMRPVWYDSTPDVGIMGTENYERFFKYSESALGGCGKDETKLFEDKVMKNVLREVTIDKEKQ